MAEILEKISAKGMLHRVEFIGNQDFVFEVMVRDKGGCGDRQYYSDHGMSVVARNKSMCVHMQQTRAATHSLFTCVCCS